MDTISDRHNSVNQGRSSLPSLPTCTVGSKAPSVRDPVSRSLKTTSCFASAAIVPDAEARHHTPGSRVDPCPASILRSASAAASLEVFSNSRASL